MRRLKGQDQSSQMGSTSFQRRCTICGIDVTTDQYEESLCWEHWTEMIDRKISEYYESIEETGHGYGHRNY